MKRFLVYSVLILSLAGCGAMDRGCANFTGDATKTCVDGVQYLQFTSGAALHVGTDGKPVRCK